jgi:probable aminopeptidase NPEPL1
VIRFQYPKTAAALLDGADTLLVVGPTSLAQPKLLEKLLPAPLASLAGELQTDTKAGDLGAVASTLTQRKPRRLVLGVLPERVSRYNSAARPEAVHRIVSAAGLTKGKPTRVAILLVVEDASLVLATLNAVGRAFPLYGEDDKSEGLVLAVLAVSPKGEVLPISSQTHETMEAARAAARLVDTPPSALDPSAFARAAKRVLGGLRGVRVVELAGERLSRSGLGGLYAVGRAALHPPRLIVARYLPAGRAPTRPTRTKKSAEAKPLHVALVGKGITFDTGGLHLKARGFMEGMKSDMGGAAACLMAFKTLVAERPKHPLSLVLCVAENAIGPHSYKPDDILRLHSGKTVEINNTDAEGRLLLADGVSWAARELGATVVVDAATLTGAQLIATGLTHAAVMASDAALERALVDAGHASGDLTHPLPFAPELFQHEFKSPIADMRNSVKNRNNAQSSCAGQFIWSHIEDTGVRWGHVDLAGPAFRADRGTGYGVALLAEAVRRIGA